MTSEVRYNTFPAWRTVTRKPFSFGHRFQLCAGHERIGKVCMFQEDALGEVPDDHIMYHNGTWHTLEPYRVARFPIIDGGIYD